MLAPGAGGSYTPAPAAPSPVEHPREARSWEVGCNGIPPPALSWVPPQSWFSPFFPAGIIPTPSLVFPCSSCQGTSPVPEGPALIPHSPGIPACLPSSSSLPGDPSLPPLLFFAPWGSQLASPLLLHSLGISQLASPITSRSAPALPSRAGGDRVHHHPVQLHVQQQLRWRDEPPPDPHHCDPGNQRVSCASRV